MKSGKKSMNRNVQYAAESANSRIYEWQADITQDGIPDRIIVNTAPILESGTGTLNTIEIYSGKTGNLIWTKRITDVHTDWLNVSLYNENGKDYILIWDPSMWQGKAVYRYRIISLSETGEEIELKSGKFAFDINNPRETDIENLITFSKEVNQYLDKSFTLADTINGRQLYSTPERKIKASFVPTEEIEAIKMRMQDIKIAKGYLQ